MQRDNASLDPLDREKLVARIEGLIASYNSAFFAERAGFGFATNQPVFIVGLPRSGTTLTEQILSAHPLLHGAGELPDLARLAVRSDKNMPMIMLTLRPCAIACPLPARQFSGRRSPED
jgi:hypothetical protein